MIDQALTQMPLLFQDNRITRFYIGGKLMHEWRKICLLYTSFAVGTDSMGVENIEGKPYTPWGGQAQSWTFVSGYLGGHAAAEYGLTK